MSSTFSPALLLNHRHRKGISAETLARQIDRSVGTVRRYEAGLVLPTAPVLGRLAHVLDVTVSDLFADETDATAGIA